MNRQLLALFFLLSVNFYASGQAWSNMNSGFDNQVNALCVYNSELYAAGNFTHDGNGINVLNHIAKWTGTNWVAVGLGLDGNVASLSVFNGELYAGGDFLLAGSDSSNRIAKWNGSNWSHIGSGFNNTVKCLYVWNNELYAGGSFTFSGSSPVARIAKLSGVVWQAIGTMTNGIVNAIVDFNNELYIGGTWSPAYIYKLSAGTWIALGTGGPDSPVQALAVFKFSGPNVLWMGGQFSGKMKTYTTSFGFGSSFNTFSGISVNALCPTYSYLYAGGAFTVLSATGIAKYNGSSPWDTVSALPDNDINAFTVFNGKLVTGGKFTNMGVAANRVAIRNTLVGIDGPEQFITSVEFFPNPLTDHAILKIQTHSSLIQPVLQFFDFLGKKINIENEISNISKFNNEIEFKIERSGLPAGIYFYRVNDEKKLITSGQFIIN